MHSCWKILLEVSSFETGSEGSGARKILYTALVFFEDFEVRLMFSNLSPWAEVESFLQLKLKRKRRVETQKRNV